MKDESYEYEIKFIEFIGDKDICDMYNEFYYDIHSLKFQCNNTIITSDKFEIYKKTLLDYLEEFQTIRINEYDKWYHTGNCKYY